MIIVTNTYTRPARSVPFFTAPNELKTEFQQNYRYTGKSIETVTELSLDGLTAVVTTKWNSRADFNEFLDAPLSENMRTLRLAHSEANSIQQSSDIKYVPTEGDMDSFEPRV